MKKEYYAQKWYPMICPNCNGQFSIQKRHVYISTDRALGTFYYARCPYCDKVLEGNTFGFLVRDYNPGWLFNHKMIIYKGEENEIRSSKN